VVIDLADLQWWQAFLAIIAVLGLSPAPWLLGMAMGRIQFTATAEANYEKRATVIKEGFDARVVDLKDAQQATVQELITHHREVLGIQVERYGEMKASRDGYREATKEERRRADKATESVSDIADALKATNHVLTSINEVAAEREVTP